MWGLPASRRLRRWCPAVGVDLGSATTRVSIAGRGTVVREPSVVAVETRTGRVLGRGTAVGRLAKQMIGRTPEGIEAVCPVQAGAIADFGVCEALMQYLVGKARAGQRGRPVFVVAVPESLTAVERQAVFNSAERAGAAEVGLLSESSAAAIGSGLPLSEPLASLVCDVGAGTTEVAAMSLGDAVARESVRVAGDAFDAAVAAWLRRHYALRIGAAEAERLKREVGSAVPLDAELDAEVRGLDTASGVPRRAVVTSEEVREALADPLDEVADAVRRTVEQLDPEMVADVADCGVVLAGGGAKLRGMAAYMSQRLGVPARLVDEPDEAVSRGLSICLDHLDQWRDRIRWGADRL